MVACFLVCGVVSTLGLVVSQGKPVLHTACRAALCMEVFFCQFLCPLPHVLAKYMSLLGTFCGVADRYLV